MLILLKKINRQDNKERHEYIIIINGDMPQIDRLTKFFQNKIF